MLSSRVLTNALLAVIAALLIAITWKLYSIPTLGGLREADDKYEFLSTAPVVVGTQ
jgi:hypothetical protein